jgi:hypothetical protein
LAARGARAAKRDARGFRRSTPSATFQNLVPRFGEDVGLYSPDGFGNALNRLHSLFVEDDDRTDRRPIVACANPY